MDKIIKKTKESIKIAQEMNEGPDYEQQSSISLASGEWIFVLEALKAFSGYPYLKNHPKDSFKTHSNTRKELVSKIEQALGQTHNLDK